MREFLISGHANQFNEEMRVRPSWVIAALIALGLVFFFLGESQSWIRDKSTTRYVSLLVFAIASIAWLIHRWVPWGGRWVTLLALIAMSYLVYALSGIPESLNFAMIPVAFGAALISLSAASVAASIETVILLLLSGSVSTGAGQAAIVIPLTLVWATFALVVVFYLPIYRATQWLWEQYQQAQEALQDTREQKVALAEALEELAHSNRQLALLNERTTMLRQVAEEAQKAKASFVARVSHEFRTPLNMIIGLTDLLAETPEIYGDTLPSALLEDIKIVNRNCEHLASLVNDVLDLSRTETGQLTLHGEWVNMAEEIEQASDVIRPLVDKKGLSLRMAIPEPPPKVFCDRTRIRQVVLNLLGNAARYTQTGSIMVEVTSEDQTVIVNVVDTGPGIPPEDTVRIFEPFYRGKNNASDEQSGSGLGLSISRQLIELHGGQIWVTSTLGAGTTFSFRLPIYPQEAPQATPGNRILEDWIWRQHFVKSGRDSLPYKQRVVVFDETAQLYSLCMHYTDEIEFIETHHLEQVIQECRNAPAHALLLNAATVNDLPHLIEETRVKIPDTPIIGCTFSQPPALADRQEIVDYLVKPVTADKLAGAIMSLDGAVHRILIADDSHDVQQLLARMLSVHGRDLDILTASTGAEALQMLRNHQPDLMLLDIVMPDMDGWHVLGLKGQDPLIRDIPVIVVTGQDLAQELPTSKVMMASMGEGLSLGKLLRCSLNISSIMLRPD